MDFKLEGFEVKEVIGAGTFDNRRIDWGVHEIGTEQAWTKTKGKGVKVAILDTGIDTTHPDLVANIREAVDFTGSRYGAVDVQGHGTHCAGVVAGCDNNIGMVGVAPEADIYAVKVLGDNGSGSFDSIIKGLQWAMSHDVDVISMSLGSASRPPEAVHTLIKQAYSRGIVIVAATGNENTQVCWPAAYEEVIAVSAIDQIHARASFSNFGVENEICAPGVDITSTYKGNGYATLSGTSMATPMIAGAAALIISLEEERTGQKPDVETIHTMLDTMTDDLGEVGRDVFYGYGLINLNKLA